MNNIKQDERERHWAATQRVAGRLTDEDLLSAIRFWLNIAEKSPEHRSTLLLLWSHIVQAQSTAWSFTEHWKEAALDMFRALDDETRAQIEYQLESDGVSRLEEADQDFLMVNVLLQAESRRIGGKYHHQREASEANRLVAALWSGAVWLTMREDLVERYKALPTVAEQLRIEIVRRLPLSKDKVKRVKDSELLRCVKTLTRPTAPKGKKKWEELVDFAKSIDVHYASAAALEQANKRIDASVRDRVVERLFSELTADEA